MTRTNAREIAIHILFQLGFSSDSAKTVLEQQMTKEQFASLGEDCYLYKQYPNKKQADYICALVEGAFLHGPELDDNISRYAKNWSFSRIPRVASTIMSVAMFEAMYMPDIPHSVAINDALEIAKGYEDPDVISFMNGILGNFVRNECVDTLAKPVQLVEELFDEEEKIEEKIDVEENTEDTEHVEDDIVSATLEPRVPESSTPEAEG